MRQDPGPRLRARALGFLEFLGVDGLLAATTLVCGVLSRQLLRIGRAPPSGVHVYGWGLASPDATVLDGDDLWVPAGSPSLTEVNASTGALVRVISGPAYRFSGPYPSAGPDAMVLDGARPVRSGRGAVAENSTTTALARSPS